MDLDSGDILNNYREKYFSNEEEHYLSVLRYIDSFK